MDKISFEQHLKDLKMDSKEFIDLMEYLAKQSFSNVVDINKNLTPFAKAVRKQKRKETIKRRLKLIHGDLL